MKVTRATGSQATFRSTSHFCEAPLRAYIREPANKWSNVGFFVAGALMWTLSARALRLVRRFGPVCIALGVGSTLFRATGTWLGSLLDSAGMQDTAAFMLVANQRWLAPTASDASDEDRCRARWFWALTILGTLSVLSCESVERRIYALEMTLAGVLDRTAVPRRRPRRPSSTRVRPGRACWRASTTS